MIGRTKSSGDAFCAKAAVENNSVTRITQSVFNLSPDERSKNERRPDPDLVVIEAERLERAVILAVEIITANRPKSSD